MQHHYAHQWQKTISETFACTVRTKPFAKRNKINKKNISDLGTQINKTKLLFTINAQQIHT